MKTRSPATVAKNPYAVVIRDLALSYPGTHEDFPWGECALKVAKKVFVFLHAGPEGMSLSTKLPTSARDALALPFTEPTHYGLGRSGWVTASFGPEAVPPMDMLERWVDESYRAVAPKKLVKALDESAIAREPVTAPAASSKARAPARKARGKPAAKSAPARAAVKGARGRKR